LESAAGWGGLIAQATILYVAPDAEAALPKMRALVDELTATKAGAEAGVSAWNGLLTIRCLACDGAALRALMIPVLECLRGVPMPPVWRL
jgi:urease accessory protein